MKPKQPKKDNKKPQAKSGRVKECNPVVWTHNYNGRRCRIEDRIDEGGFWQIYIVFE